MTVSATYMNSRGDKLPFFRDVNFNPATAQVEYQVEGAPMGRFPFYRGARPNAADFQRMTVMESTIETQYNALVLSATKRFVDGLMFNVNYTLSKAEDNGQSSATFFGGNLPFDSLNYRTSGPDNTMFPSNNDRRHRFVGSFHYQPEYLWGIGLSGILTLESGLPITQRITGNLNAATGATNTTGTNGTGGSFVAPWVGFNTDRQTGRNTFDIRASQRLQARRQQAGAGAVGGLQPLQHGELRDSSPTPPTRSSGRPRTMRRPTWLTVNLRADPGYLVARTASSNFWGMRDMQFGLKFLW